ncbi:MAG: hypothetical protein MRERV_2c001, partial [Mycoplasmataceae bacterium RV_VA103A]
NQANCDGRCRGGHCRPISNQIFEKIKGSKALGKKGK